MKRKQCEMKTARKELSERNGILQSPENEFAKRLILPPVSPAEQLTACSGVPAESLRFSPPVKSLAFRSLYTPYVRTVRNPEQFPGFFEKIGLICKLGEIDKTAATVAPLIGYSDSGGIIDHSGPADGTGLAFRTGCAV